MSARTEKKALKKLSAVAYECFDRGDLVAADGHFAELLRRVPTNPYWHYMRGLANKYLRNWPASLECNLRAQAHGHNQDEATIWNAAIAATALGDWAQAREQWARCGFEIPGTTGPIEGQFGHCSIRLNPWGKGETLFAERIDPVRARLLNIPLPESGFRCGDVVLHDGASTGERIWGERQVPVFNALQRLRQSDFQSFAVFLNSPGESDATALRGAKFAGVQEIEDWTESIKIYCLRCSYGVAHRHTTTAACGEWRQDRSFGVSAIDLQAVDSLLAQWLKGGKGRSIESVECRQYALSEPEPGRVWWQSPG